MDERRLRRRIDRARRKLANLVARKEHLSEHGYWEIGYLQGQIGVLEDWLDELVETKEAIYA